MESPGSVLVCPRKRNARQDHLAPRSALDSLANIGRGRRSAVLHGMADVHLCHPKSARPARNFFVSLHVDDVARRTTLGCSLHACSCSCFLRSDEQLDFTNTRGARTPFPVADNINAERKWPTIGRVHRHSLDKMHCTARPLGRESALSYARIGDRPINAVAGATRMVRPCGPAIYCRPAEGST